MHNSKPSIFRQIRACVYSHFSAWLHSPRTIVMGIVILLLCLYACTQLWIYAVHEGLYSAFRRDGIQLSR